MRKISDAAQAYRDIVEGTYVEPPLVPEGDDPCHGPQDTYCPSCGLGISEAEKQNDRTQNIRTRRRRAPGGLQRRR
jgi:hypothetical protein